MDILRRLERKMAKPQNLNTVQRISMFFWVQRPLLGAQIATKSDLGALGSTLELLLGSWRRLEGSWRHLGALLVALGVLLERFKGPE